VGWARGTYAEFLAAAGFLTRVPVAAATADAPRTGAPAFGLVGAAVGAAGALALLGLGGRAPLAAAGLGLGAMALASGALHLDGLADTADALAAPDAAAADRARKAPPVGPAGVAAITLVLLIDVGLLATLGADDAGRPGGGPVVAALACVVAAAGSRALPVLIAWFASIRAISSGRPVRPGLGSWFVGSVGPWSASLATGSVIALASAAAAALGRPAPVLGALGGTAIGVLVAAWLERLRHGLDGDALGAIIEIGFAAILLVTVIAQ
jgi:adenosylcobinamide-GDP ribazoletransferase